MFLKFHRCRRRTTTICHRIIFFSGMVRACPTLVFIYHDCRVQLSRHTLVRLFPRICYLYRLIGNVQSGSAENTPPIIAFLTFRDRPCSAWDRRLKAKDGSLARTYVTASDTPFVSLSATCQMAQIMPIDSRPHDFWLRFETNGNLNHLFLTARTSTIALLPAFRELSARNGQLARIPRRTLPIVHCYVSRAATAPPPKRMTPGFCGPGSCFSRRPGAADAGGTRRPRPGRGGNSARKSPADSEFQDHLVDSVDSAELRFFEHRLPGTAFKLQACPGHDESESMASSS
jgi:hypothetical protein